MDVEAVTEAGVPNSLTPLASLVLAPSVSSSVSSLNPKSFLVLGNVLGPATGDDGNGFGGLTSGAQDVLNRSLRDEAESDRGLVMIPCVVKGSVAIVLSCPLVECVLPYCCVLFTVSYGYRRFL